MKLTNQNLDVLVRLIDNKLAIAYNDPEGMSEHFKPEILQQLFRKLDKMYE